MKYFSEPEKNLHQMKNRKKRKYKFPKYTKEIDTFFSFS